MSKPKIIGLLLLGISIGALLFAYIADKEYKVQKEAIENNKNIVNKTKAMNLDTGINSSLLEKNKNLSEYIKSSLTKPEEYNIEKTIATFIKYINNKDYEKAYNMFDKEYIEAFDYSFEYFKSQYKFNYEVMYIIKDITSDKNYRYIRTIEVEIINAKDYREKTGQKLSSIKKNFRIFENGKLADRKILNITNSNIKEIQKNMQMAVIKEVEETQSLTYKIVLTNHSNEYFHIKQEPMGIQGNTSIGRVPHKIVSNYYNSYDIEPNGERAFLINFDTMHIESIIITLSTGEEYEFKV